MKSSTAAAFGKFPGREERAIQFHAAKTSRIALDQSISFQAVQSGFVDIETSASTKAFLATSATWNCTAGSANAGGTPNLVSLWRATTTSNKPSARRRHTYSPSNVPLPTPLRGRLKTHNIKMAAVQTLPKDLSKLNGEVKLFGKWDTQECVLAMFYVQKSDQCHLPSCLSLWMVVSR